MSLAMRFLQFQFRYGGRYSDGLHAGRLGFDSRQRKRDFSLLHSVQAGSRAHRASYSVGTGGYFPEGKEAGA
jgi:hypothetical protein